MHKSVYLPDIPKKRGNSYDFRLTRAGQAVKATSNDKMDFSAPPPGGKLGAADKEHLMDQVKQQIALANAQELLQVLPMCSCISHRLLVP